MTQELNGQTGVNQHVNFAAVEALAGGEQPAGAIVTVVYRGVDINENTEHTAAPTVGFGQQGTVVAAPKAAVPKKRGGPQGDTSYFARGQVGKSVCGRYFTKVARTGQLVQAAQALQENYYYPVFGRVVGISKNGQFCRVELTPRAAVDLCKMNGDPRHLKHDRPLAAGATMGMQSGHEYALVNADAYRLPHLLRTFFSSLPTAELEEAVAQLAGVETPMANMVRDTLAARQREARATACLACLAGTVPTDTTVDTGGCTAFALLAAGGAVPDLLGAHVN